MKNTKLITINKRPFIVLGIVFISVLLFTTCDNFSDEIETQYGKISIDLITGETPLQSVRTIFPIKTFNKYEYEFFKEGEVTGVVKTPDNGLFTLELGSYTVKVKAYTSNEESYTLAATGSSQQFSVAPGENEPVKVTLSSVNTGENGQFNYTINYPAGAKAEITLQCWPDTENYITLTPENINNGITQTLQLEPGSYLLTVFINRDDRYAGLIESIHILPSITTEYTKTFYVNDLLDSIPITIVNISIIPPVKNAEPNPTASGSGNFTISEVTWLPVDSVFLGDKEYSASVTLTANKPYTFTEINNAYINGQPAYVSNNTGKTATLSYTFPKTEDKIPTDIEILSDPYKMNYLHGEWINLNGLIVKVTYDDETQEDIEASGFYNKNITAAPYGYLIHLTHNNKPITITYGNITIQTTTILSVNPRNITFNVSAISEQTYNGNELKPYVTVRDNNDLLTETDDYTVTYSNNINRGTATVTVTGAGNYAGSSGSTSFTINPRIINFDIDPIPSQLYTGSALTPEVKVWDDTTELTSGIDYIVIYANNIDTGIATVTINGLGNYEGSIGYTNFTIYTNIITFNIDPIPDQTYNRMDHYPEITVRNNDSTILTAYTDYTLKYDNNLNVGTATVTVTGAGSYTGSSGSATFTIKPRVITFDTILNSIPPQTYNGNPFVFDTSYVYDSTILLKINTDYTMEYSDNTNVGTATVIITGIGNYAGSYFSTNFIINPKILNINNISIYKTYDGTTTVTSFGSPSLSGLIWGETASVDTSGVVANYAQSTVGTGIEVTYSGSFGMLGGTANPSNYQITQPAGLTGGISIASPNAPNSPTENSKTTNSITLNPPDNANPIFALEYGISTVNSASYATWQDSPTFTGLQSGGYYYFYARYKADPSRNYVSSASSPLAARTLLNVPESKFEYYWVDAHGDLVTTSGGATTVAPGETLTITAQGSGYVVKYWYLNGVNTGHTENTYNFSSTAPGKHTVSLFVEKDGKPYNTNIVITVQ